LTSCQCGASCCCQASAPLPKPIDSKQSSERQLVSRQLAALQAYAATQVVLECGSMPNGRTLSAHLVSLTPTLQREHVRIQT
jgi:hypothetical protein